MTGQKANEDILLPFERGAIADHYIPYFEAKRTNFFASIQGAPNLWRYYQLLDKVILTEFEDLNVSKDPAQMFPVALLFNSHAKIRISIELAFTRCMEEARSVLRDAIEAAVFAHYMKGDSVLQNIWWNKDDSKQAAKDFTQRFEKNKKAQLFNGLPELYENWCRLSETGAHSTPQAIVSRLKIIEDQNNVHFHVNYTGLENREWEPETFTLLLIVSSLEKLIFNDYRTRLQLDFNLVHQRQIMQQLKEALRHDIILRHNIQPPNNKPKLAEEGTE